MLSHQQKYVLDYVSLLYHLPWKKKYSYDAIAYLEFMHTQEFFAAHVLLYE